MKKIIFLIISLLFITGCEAVYTIHISDNIFRESLEVNNEDPASWIESEEINYAYEQIIRYYSELNIPVDYNYEPNPHTSENDEEDSENVKFYRVELIDTEDNLGLKITHPFNGIGELSKSPIIMEHWPPEVLIKEDNLIKFSSGLENYVFDVYERLTKLTVRLSSTYLVVEHNADEVANNMFYWDFTNEDYADKEINFVIDTDQVVDTSEINQGPEDFITSRTLLIIYSVILAIVIVIVVPYIYFKVKNSNR